MLLSRSAVVNGEQSQLLSKIHIALLRLLQMDLEDAHATGAIQASFIQPCTLRPVCHEHALCEYCTILHGSSHIRSFLGAFRKSNLVADGCPGAMLSRTNEPGVKPPNVSSPIG